MNDEFGDRMKGYEEASNFGLPKRLPIILRLDGRAFHTLTRVGKYQKPFDTGLHATMVDITKHLCDQIVNARFGYTQSDEISILLYPKYTTSGYWFDNRVQKMTSVAASTAASIFALARPELRGNIIPTFDARVFVLPPMEVHNYFWWRQADAIRNSISGLAQAHFTHKQLHGVNSLRMLEMLKEKGIDWESCSTFQRWGTGVQRIEEDGRSGWRACEIPKWITAKDYFNSVLQEPTMPALAQ